MSRKIVRDFTILAESLQDIIARFDGTGRYIYINNSIETETGLPADTFIGKNHSELNFPKSFISPWNLNINKVIHSGLPASFKFKYDLPLCKSVYEARLIPEKNTSGKTETVLAVIKNISNNKVDALTEENTNILFDDGDSLADEADKIELAEIIAAEDIQSLMDNFYNLTKITTAIIDKDGKVLVSVGWQNMCTLFHRSHPDTIKNCLESNTELTKDIPEDEFKLYKCKNGLWNLATPIFVGGRHKGNIFMGQFFFEDEILDYDFFKSNARKFGFDENEYLLSLEKIPRLSKEKLNNAKAIFHQFAHSLSKLSYNNIRLTRLLNERGKLMVSLSEGRERFRNLFEKPKAIMLLIDPESSQIVDANNSASEFYGYTRTQLCKMKIQNINILSSEEIAAELKAALNESRNYFIFPHRLADNRIRWVEVYSSPVTSADNKPLLFSIIHDITERREAEDQLRKLSRAVEQSPNSIIITDARGNIEYANPEFTNITGYSVSEVFGKKPGIFKSGKTDPALYKNLWETILSGKQWHGSVQNKKKSGEIYWESVNVAPVFDSRGTITHFVAVKEDITEQKNREQQLNKLNRTLQALRHIGDAIVRTNNEHDFLNEVCKIIVDDCGHSLVWIGYAEFNEEKTIKVAASSGFEEDFFKKQYAVWSDTEYGRGPAGTAIRTGEISYCMDMRTDPRFKPWREEAVKADFASAIALPLKIDGKTFGVISIYGKEPSTFSSDEMNLLAELADDITYGVTVLRLKEAHSFAEQELKKHHDELEILVKQRTTELLTANEILKEAQEVAHFGSWHLNLKTNHLIWSDEVFKIFGVDPQTFVPSLDAFLNTIHPDDRDVVAKSFAESVSNRTFYNIDHRIILPDGEIRTVHEQCNTHYDTDGSPVNALGVVRDITDLKKAEQEIENHKIHLEELVKLRTEELAVANSMLKLEIDKEKQVELLIRESLEKEKELNALKSHFISTTSHEFRTPLTAILSSMQLIQRYRSKWSDDKIEDQFNKIKTAVLNLTKLLDDILTLSHADSGRIIFNPKEIDLYQFCLEILEEIKHLSLPAHKFNYEFASEIKNFVLDPKLIRFIMINLLSNAFKYSPDGGRIKLTILSTPEMIGITVSDEGIGIPADDIENLFNPFFRAGNTGEIEGTGLGLSIVKRAVELHGGNIICDSTMGVGTKFVVNLPWKKL